MQFITSGNRIAVENFTLGDLYTITFTSGTYINSACIGIGENFVSFQRNEPELLFTLTMETAELVSSIDLYAGGTGTNNYADLTNKPQINSVELIGNKTAAQLGLQSAITEESPLSSSLVSGLGSAAAADTSDFATAAQGTLAASAIQSAGTGLTKDGTSLNHSNSVTAQTSASFSLITFDAQGHITGSTEATAAQLDALNSGVTSTDVAQIETNKTNILSIAYYGGGINFLPVNANNIEKSQADNITVTVSNGVVILNGTQSGGIGAVGIPFKIKAGQYWVKGCPSGGSDSSYRVDIRTTTGGTLYSNNYDYGDGCLLTVNTNTTLVYNIRLVERTYTNLTFKAMVILKSVYDEGCTIFQPYAMSNVELTNSKEPFSRANITDDVANSATSGTLYGTLSLTGFTDAWGVLYTYVLNAEGNRILQICETPNARKKRFYSGTWSAWA